MKSQYINQQHKVCCRRRDRPTWANNRHICNQGRPKTKSATKKATNKNVQNVTNKGSTNPVQYITKESENEEQRKQTRKDAAAALS